ncbi:MAG: DNA mismatch repair protein MutS [Oligoflexia bacterium]|nr:DNA mismatch repair protein MutS [Oligoflexia bacterium]
MQSQLEQLPDTPMWKQYKEIKVNALDSLLFYRMGDFYELFQQDAIEASEILGITLTARNKGEEIPVPMCGVPHHASNSYINKLVQAGKKVAICEQTEAATATKGIVKREIVRIVSPGMVYDPEALAPVENSFSIALDKHSENLNALSFAMGDLSTGKIEFCSEIPIEAFLDFLGIANPKEILITSDFLDTDFYKKIILEFPWLQNTKTILPLFYFSKESGYTYLKNHFQLTNLEAMDLSDQDTALGVLGAFFRQAKETQKQSALEHLQMPVRRALEGFVQIDESTIDHLDILPKSDKQTEESLFYHLNKTSTFMGARKLKDWLIRPLSKKSEINARLESVEECYENIFLLSELTDLFGGMRDIERLVARIGLNSANPRDLVGLKNILEQLPRIRTSLANKAKTKLMVDIRESINELPALFKRLDVELLDEPASSKKEGNIFKKGWNNQLDELIELTENGKDTIERLEASEREATGIGNLKIKYNKVFGYFIEVSQAKLASVPARYIRKQTTANAERYITPELKTFEEKVLSASEKRMALEEQLFEDLIAYIKTQTQELLKTASSLATLDVILAFAKVARENNYVRPELIDTCELEIQEGKHPALMKLVGKNKFINNSIHFTESENLFLITGPNMAGKSTFMRQTALITLMAHAGSFVSAKKARIGLVDRISTRVGASDRIGKGQSTFMVEMNEIAKILLSATNRSLLIIDEIGRGTSTYDGLSIAWSILEDIAKRIQCRTLFATHYHELTELETSLSGLCNLHVEVAETNQTITFLHTVKKGKANGSYGIEVAKLAGVPRPVLERAKEILTNLESKERPKKKSITKPSEQMSFFDPPPAVEKQEQKELAQIKEALTSFDLVNSTPLQAMNRLKDLQDSLKGPKRPDN